MLNKQQQQKHLQQASVWFLVFLCRFLLFRSFFGSICLLVVRLAMQQHVSNYFLCRFGANNKFASTPAATQQQQQQQQKHLSRAKIIQREANHQQQQQSAQAASQA